MTDAIQQDAPQADATTTETQVTEQAERPLSQREAAMAALSQTRREQLNADGVSFEADAPKAEETPEVVEQEEQIAAQTAPTVLSDGFDKVKVRAKVDGEEVEVSLDQVMRQFQKHSTADRRLAEATRLLREAETRAALAQPQQTNQEVQPQEQPEQSTKEFLHALFEGNEENAEQALEKLIQGRQAVQPIPDAAAIARQVKQQIEVESALSGFANDYADVVNDPYLADMADRLLEHGLQSGEQFADALKNAGEQVRGWLHSKTGAAPANVASTTRNERLDRKATLDPIKGANVTATSPTQQPRSEEQIRADALAALIKSRPGMAAN